MAKTPAATAKPTQKAKSKKAEAEAEAVNATSTEKPKKAAAAKAPPKGTKVDKPKAGAKPNALQQPLQPSEALAAVVGAGTMARGEVVSKVWEYIKANKLQNPADGREILADEKLEKVFGRPKVTMFEMNKYLAQHLS